MIVCQVCGRECKNFISLGSHIREHKLTIIEYYDKYLKKENEGKCKICENKTNFINSNKGYAIYCSNDCYNKDKGVIEKRKQTCLEKYGSENPFGSKEIREKIKKINVERYGYTSPLKNKDIKEKLLKTREERYGSRSYHNIDKMKSTLIERYGVDNCAKVEEFKNKSIKTAIERYGNATNGKAIGLKRKENYVNKLKDLGYNVIGYDENEYEIECKQGHRYKIKSNLAYARLEYGIELCIECNPVDIQSSASEQELFQFIKENVNYGVINKCDTEISKELDIYIPELKIAFEYNGLYWHSDKYKDRKYHFNKTNECKEKGIRLFHIFENDWKNKKEIVQSMILNILGKSNSIYARKCEIKLVEDKNIIKEFLNSNHLQGYTFSKVNLGLYYNDELVSLMLFDRSKFNKNYEWELSRFCNKLNTSVVGGASKLLKYFIKNYSPKNIVSYSDRTWSNGNLYNKLSFKHVKTSNPSYFYVDKISFERIHRFNFRKSELKKMGYDVENKTEHEIMHEIDKHFIIWDCGKDTFELKL